MFATTLRSDCSPASVCTTVDLLPLLGEGLVAVKTLGGGANLVGPGAAAALNLGVPTNCTVLGYCPRF